MCLSIIWIPKERSAYTFLNFTFWIQRKVSHRNIPSFRNKLQENQILKFFCLKKKKKSQHYQSTSFPSISEEFSVSKKPWYFLVTLSLYFCVNQYRDLWFIVLFWAAEIKGKAACRYPQTALCIIWMPYYPFFCLLVKFFLIWFGFLSPIVLLPLYPTSSVSVFSQRSNLKDRKSVV